MKNELRAKQIAEAVKRMKEMKVLEENWKDFEENQNVWFSNCYGGSYDSGKEEYAKELEEFLEKFPDALPYYIIPGKYVFTGGDVMDVVNILYVSAHEEEWVLDHRDYQENKLVYAYAFNRTAPFCSEVGAILVQPANGGLIRIA